MNHHIDVSRGAHLRDGPKEGPYGGHQRFWRQVGGSGIARSKRRLAIMIYLATGWTPWGVRLDTGVRGPTLSLCGREYIMCCGHVIREKEAQQFVDAGLLAEGEPDHFTRPTLVITDAGREWLKQNW